MANEIEIVTPNTDWSPPENLPDIFNAKTIAIDVETKDPNIKNNGPGWATGDGEVIGYAVAVDNWAGYIPIRHEKGGNLDERIVNKWLKKVFESPADKIMHNAQYDTGWIRRMGFKINGRIIDTMLITSLLDENRFSYTLNSICYDFIKKTKSEKGLVEAARSFGIDPKAEMYKMPAMYVGAYAQADAEITLELWKYLSAKLHEEELDTIVNLELDLLPCLVDMTWRGVRVDQDNLERTRDALLKREAETLKEIRRISGKDVEIWANKSIEKAFLAADLTYPRTEKGAPSFTKAFLSSHPHELPQLIVKARALNKTVGTFINTIIKHCRADGRIHSHINQIRSDDGGTVSGRISMNNPNLQQIPARDPELGPMIRSLFLPEEGEKWASIDFSQQEPRILVHYASLFGKSRGLDLKGINEFVTGYRENPDMDFHTMVAEMAGIPRKQAKTINLGMMYGMGQAKLADQLDIELDDAKELISQYHTRVPFVRELQRGVQSHLNRRESSGCVHSLLGRKCRFDMWEPSGYGIKKAFKFQEAVNEYGHTTKLVRAYTYKALNRLIQASAADMTKKAMVDIYKTGRVPLIQIHDEIAISVKDDKEAKEIAEIMENALPLEVPNKCDVEIGKSWGDSAS